MIKARRYRDLTLIDLNEEQILVVACDSAGGIGEKEYDSVRVDPAIPAYYTVVGASMELLSFGARPISLINNLCVEMEPTGRRIIQGMKYAIRDLDIDEENFITGSTEENFPVTTTGMGVTMLGMIDRLNWQKPETTSGLLAAVVGLPKVGEEVREDKEKTIMNIARLKRLKSREYIKEILPVGSKGILFELGEMADSNDLDYELYEDISLDLYRTAGPSTCVVVSIGEEYLSDLKEFIDIPVEVVGRFIERGK